MEIKAKIGTRIVELRNRLGLSQSELARRVNALRSTVYGWEVGKSKPEDQAMIDVAKVLGTSISYLYGETDDPRPAPDWRNGSGPSNAQEAKLAEASMQNFLQLACLLYSDLLCLCSALLCSALWRDKCDKS